MSFQALENGDVDEDSFISSMLLGKSENGQCDSDSSCDRSAAAQSNNLKNTVPLGSIEQEPENENSEDDVHPAQAEIFELKEEIGIGEDKPKWELIAGTSNAGLLRDQREMCDDVYLEQAPLFKCQECSYETRIKSYLTNHHKIKHAKDTEVYKCGECSYETRIKGTFNKHYKLKHAIDAIVFKCEECSYETRYKGNFIRHQTLKHIEEVEMYKCEECSYETKDKGFLTKHYKIKHTKNAEVYKCGECSYETKEKGNFTQHYI